MTITEDMQILRKQIFRAREVAKKSRHPTVKVGAGVYAKSGKLLAEACNALPPGVKPKKSRFKQGVKSRWFQCAEQLALAQVARKGISTEGTTLVSTEPLCENCGGLAIAMGVKIVGMPAAPLNPHFKPKWLESMKYGQIKLVEAGVNVLTIALD